MEEATKPFSSLEDVLEHKEERRMGSSRCPNLLIFCCIHVCIYLLGPRRRLHKYRGPWGKPAIVFCFFAIGSLLLRGYRVGLAAALGVRSDDGGGCVYQLPVASNSIVPMTHCELQNPPIVLSMKGLVCVFQSQLAATQCHV